MLSDMISNALLDSELGAEAGPWGAVIGIVIGAATPAGEILYDNEILPATNSISDWLHEHIINPFAQLESSLDRGWHN